MKQTELIFLPQQIFKIMCSYSAQKSLELSKFDQGNLKLKINGWKKETPSCNYYFRPHNGTDKTNEE